MEVLIDSKHASRALAAALLFALLALGEPVFAAAPFAPATGSRAADLAKIVASDRAASRVESVIFGAWLGASPLLTLALGDSPNGVPHGVLIRARSHDCGLDGDQLPKCPCEPRVQPAFL
jgi:hypothetical protein